MSTDKQALKQQLATEAARLLCNGDAGDFQQAKQKAAARLCPGLRPPMPDNRMLEAEIRRYRQLFRATDQQAWQTQLMAEALEAMRFFAVFSPRLIGAIVQGTATQDSTVDLLGYSETPGEIAQFLQQHGIRHQQDSRLLSFSNDEDGLLPVCRFLAGERALQVTEIPLHLRHHRIVSGNLRQRVESWSMRQLEQALARPVGD